MLKNGCQEKADNAEKRPVLPRKGVKKEVQRLGSTGSRCDYKKLEVEKIYPLLWGNKLWSLPFVKTLSWLADKVQHRLWLNQFWVSQFLCITRQQNKP